MGDSTVIGVHVAGGMLRRAELASQGGRNVVRSLTAIPFVASAGGASGGVQPPANGTRFVAAMPAVDVMSRCWPLPRVNDHKLRQLVAHQLEADLPVPLEDITWGYRRSASPQAGECTVLAQAVRSERVSGYMNGLAKAGLGVDVLTTEAEALAGLYQHGLKGTGAGAEVEALILAGENEWLVCVFKDALVQTIGRISVDAERPEGACRECRQMLAGNDGTTVQRIRWCAAADSPELAALLAEVCGVPVEPVEASDVLVSANGEPLPATQLVEYGPAIGLALTWPAERDGGVIRLAGREAEEAAEAAGRFGRILARTWTWTAAAAVLLVVAVAIHVGSLRAQTRRMQATIDRGLTSSTSLADLAPKIRAMQRLNTYRIPVETITADVCRAVKPAITLSSLQLARGQRMTIKGTAKDPKAVFTFADDLRKSGKFKNLKLERTAPAQGGEFVISVELADVKAFSAPGLRGGR